MGKINQLGNLEEVLELCTVDERLLPCVDFGHLYARSLGELEGRAACAQMLDRMEAVLGEERASGFHSHFSKIEFTLKGGEKRHLCFSDPGYGPDFRPLAEEVARRGWGTVDHLRVGRNPERGRPDYEENLSGGVQAVNHLEHLRSRLAGAELDALIIIQ